MSKEAFYSIFISLEAPGENDFWEYGERAQKSRLGADGPDLMLDHLSLSLSKASPWVTGLRMEPAARLAAPFATLITLFWQLRLRSRETAEQRRLSLQDAPLRSLVVGLLEVVQLRGDVQENVQVFF